MRRVPPVLMLMALAGCMAPPVAPFDEASVTFPALTFETAMGDFTAILFNDTPATNAFITGLVERGYYDGRAFGRIIPGFVIQEVDRTGGTTDQTETVTAEFGTRVMFSAGALGIARNADPESGSSEFFVMDFATSRLYGNYTAFAQVVDGLDVVHAIARAPAVRTGPAPFVVGSPPGSPVAFGLHDRVPVDPVEMTKVSVTTLTLPLSQAALYPLQVGETYSTPTLRATLEWPHDLQAGRASVLTWYLAGRDAGQCSALPGDPCAADDTAAGVITATSSQDPPPVDASGATIRYDGAASGTVAFADDEAAPGALAFDWTPPMVGGYQFHVEKDGNELAIANITVAR